MKKLEVRGSRFETMGGRALATSQEPGARSRNRRGQSVVEYLVIAAAVIAALIAVRGAYQAATQNFMQAAVDAIPRTVP